MNNKTHNYRPTQYPQSYNQPYVTADFKAQSPMNTDQYYNQGSNEIGSHLSQDNQIDDNFLRGTPTLIRGAES
jgi:hypothetical protein